MNNNYRLQLRHGADGQPFSTREEVISYINGQLQYGKVSLLPYEPILFFYGADNAKNAVIMVGLPDGKTKDGKSYFLVDTANLQEQIDGGGSEDKSILEKLNDEIAERKTADDEIKAELNTETESRENADKALEDAIAEETNLRKGADAIETTERKETDEKLNAAIKFSSDDIHSLIDACGLIYNEKLADNRVSYSPDSHDEVIRDSKSLSDAIDKVSKFAISLGKSLKISVEDTDTVDLTMIEDSNIGGSIIKADVNIAGADGLSKKTFDNNIIGKTTEGLYAAASIEPSTTNPNILIFKTSGYVDGQFRVDAYETEVPLTAYKGDNGKTTGISVNVDDSKNVISASLSLSSSDTNILKLEDGEYVVDGRAKNIVYQDTTVAQALTNQKNRLDDIDDAIAEVKAVSVNGSETSTSTVTVSKSTKGDFTVSNDVKLGTDNSIIISNGGISANVKANFQKGTSTLVLSVGSTNYNIDLSELAVSVLKKAEYDSVTEEIVLTFIVGDDEKTMRIPVGTLIHDVEVDDTDTIDLSLKSVSGGPNRISGEVKLDKAHSDNILTATSNGLYVSNSYITTAVQEEAENRKEEDKLLQAKIDDVLTLANKNKDGLSAEITRAEKAEQVNATAIAQEIKDARAAEQANADAIAKNNEAIKTIENAIVEESARAKKAEQANADAITTEATRAEKAETANAAAISSEIDRAKEKEEDLLKAIGVNTEKIAQNSSDILSEAKTARAAEKTNADAIAAEAARAKEAETVNATNISGEILRAKSAEEANSTSIATETNRAISAEATLDGKITTNTEGITSVTALANVNKSDIANEITRAKAAEEAISVAIDVEKNRAVAAENVNSTKITEEIARAKDAETKNTASIDAAKVTINTISTSLAEEISRAKAAEAVNATAVATETNRAIASETNLQTNIDKNASDISAISTSVGNIELKKEGDLAYALYVNGAKHGEFTIPQDQFLKSVNYDVTTKELVFVFRTTGGEVTQKINISDLVDTYTNGDGLLLNANTFSVDYSKVASVESLTAKIGAEADRASEKEADLLEKINANVNSIAEEKNRAKTAEQKNAEAIIGNSELIAANAKAISEEAIKARAAENVNAINIGNEISRAKEAEQANAATIAKEAETARTAEKTNADAIAAENLRAVNAENSLTTKIEALSGTINTSVASLDGKIANEATTARAAEIKNAEAIENEAIRAKQAEQDNLSKINTKANSSDVYTKNEIVTTLTDYAKNDDVQIKLDAKLNTSDAQNVYATKESLQEVKDSYATKESLNTVQDNLGTRINENVASIDNFGLTYNAATSELVYTDKNGKETSYQLYSGSLIKNGTFDTKTNSIVLTIETAGVESQITIPVSELLSDITGKIDTNTKSIADVNTALTKLAKDWEVGESSTVQLTKNTSGDKDSLSASVKVASSNKQAIQATTNGLYVSNDLEDYTVVFGAAGTISGQTAISTLLETTTEVSKDVSTLKEQVKTNMSDIADAKTSIDVMKSNISTLQVDVKTNTNSLTLLNDKVNTVEKEVATYTERIYNIENKTATIVEQIATISSNIIKLQEAIDKITGDDGEISKINSEFEKVKKVTGYETYTSEKTMSDRLDTLENVTVGPKDGSVEGSVWAAIASMIDAGVFS